MGDADLLLHVVDASHPDPEGQIAAVREVLAEVEGVNNLREVLVLNKADLAEPETLTRLRVAGPDVIAVSARTGEGIEELRELVASLLPRPAVEVDLVVPYTRGDLISQAHTSGDVLAEEHLEGGTRLHALVDSQLAAALHAAVAG